MNIIDHDALAKILQDKVQQFLTVTMHKSTESPPCVCVNSLAKHN